MKTTKSLTMECTTAVKGTGTVIKAATMVTTIQAAITEIITWGVVTGIVTVATPP